jgi:predicted nucleic acid-binding protein
MILVDTAVWIDHIRAADEVLANLLDEGRIVVHSAVIVEIALGHLRYRDLTLRLLGSMKPATVATDHEVLELVGAHRLEGRGIGYVDAHLLASARLDRTTLWTRDKRLLAAAAEAGVNAMS